MFPFSSCEISVSKDTGADFGSSGEPRERFRAGAEGWKDLGASWAVWEGKSHKGQTAVGIRWQNLRKGSQGDHCWWSRLWLVCGVKVQFRGLWKLTQKLLVSYLKDGRLRSSNIATVFLLGLKIHLSNFLITDTIWLPW